MKRPPTHLPASGLDVDLSTAATSPLSGLLGTRDTHMTVDLRQAGRQMGHLALPWLDTRGASEIRVPVCCLRGSQPGPTVTLIAGVHGDEYEGSVVLHRLARELHAEDVHGCLIIVPALNVAGLELAQRTLPHTDEDLDLCFPGRVDGSLGERLGHAVLQRLIQPADLVVDLRSGGGRLQFAPAAAVRLTDAGRARHPHTDAVAEQAPDTLAEAAMVAFGAPNCVRLPQSRAGGSLQSTVRALGKAYLQSELGGGGGCGHTTRDIAEVGVRNVLCYMGVLDEQIRLRASRMLEVPDERYFVHAPTSGLLEPFARPGSDIWLGDTLACLVNLAHGGDAPHRIEVPRNAVLLALHHGGPVRTGELVAILAEEVQR